MRSGAFAPALFVVGLAGRLAAQAPAPIIDTIIVLNHNIFDSGEDAPRFIARVGDALHIRTREWAIRRTLTFSPGEPYDSARVVESARALRALNAFRSVRLDSMRVGDRLALVVETADGWSTNPQISYASSGGSVSWAAGVVEANLFGTVTSLTAIHTKTPDRSSDNFLYESPHFIGRRTRLELTYEPMSDGREGLWYLGVPFYETATPRSLATSGEVATQRVLTFRDGKLDSIAKRHALRFDVEAGVALRASTRSYWRLWFGGGWRRENFVAEFATNVPRSTFATVGAGIEFGHTRFREVQRFNTYARREDLDLSQNLRLGLWAAPRAWGYPAGRAGVGAEMTGQQSAVWRGGFALLHAQLNGVYNGTGLDSAAARGSVTVANQGGRHTGVLHLDGGMLRRPTPARYFDCWPDGPRLFAAHAFTGTRTVWLALEDRILVTDQLWGLLGVGIAPFFDWGGAWFDDEPMRTGSDVGASLRLGPTRTSRGDVSEFAFGYRFAPRLEDSGWAVSVRRSTTF